MNAFRISKWHRLTALAVLALALCLPFARAVYAQAAGTGEVTVPQLVMSGGMFVVMGMVFAAHWLLDWMKPNLPQSVFPIMGALVAPLFNMASDALTGLSVPVEWTPFIGWLGDYLDDQRYWVQEWLKKGGVA